MIHTGELQLPDLNGQGENNKTAEDIAKAAGKDPNAPKRWEAMKDLAADIDKNLEQDAAALPDGQRLQSVQEINRLAGVRCSGETDRWSSFGTFSHSWMWLAWSSRISA